MHVIRNNHVSGELEFKSLMQITITNGLFQGIINPVKNNTLWKDRQYGGSPMDLRHISRMVVISSLLLFTVSLAITLADPRERKYSGKELDELMAKVWQNCKTDLENLRGYAFSETEVIEDNGALGLAKRYSYQTRIDYVWAPSNDGYLVPRPTHINGKEAPDLSRMDSPWNQPGYAVFDLNTGTFYSAKWANTRHHRPPWLVLETILDLFDHFAQCNFRDRFFPRFKYEPGKYKYAGAKEYEGNRVIEVRYKTKSYKTNLGNKLTVEIKMLILPEENQLVKVTLSTSSSSGRYEYSMMMKKPGDDWLLNRFCSYARTSSGNSRRVSDFHDYIKTGVKARFWLEDV
jgi:hypothetical protein